MWATSWGPSAFGRLVEAPSGVAGDDRRPLGVAERGVGDERRGVHDEGHPLAVRGGPVAVDPVEAQGPFGDHVEHRPVVGRRREPGVHVPEERVEVPAGDVGLRREVPEEGAAGDAGGGGDLLDGRVLEAAFGEELERGLLDLLDRREGVRRVPHGSRARRAMACTPPLETSTSFPVRPCTIAAAAVGTVVRHGCFTFMSKPRETIASTDARRRERQAGEGDAERREGVVHRVHDRRRRADGAALADALVAARAAGPASRGGRTR